jgi:hypothetical protein
MEDADRFAPDLERMREQADPAWADHDVPGGSR